MSFFVPRAEQQLLRMTPKALLALWKREAKKTANLAVVTAILMFRVYRRFRAKNCLRHSHTLSFRRRRWTDVSLWWIFTLERAFYQQSRTGDRWRKAVSFTLNSIAFSAAFREQRNKLCSCAATSNDGYIISQLELAANNLSGLISRPLSIDRSRMHTKMKFQRNAGRLLEDTNRKIVALCASR